MHNFVILTCALRNCVPAWFQSSNTKNTALSGNRWKWKRATNLLWLRVWFLSIFCRRHQGFSHVFFFAPKGGCFRGKLKTSGSGRRKQFAVFSVFRAKSDLENIYVAWFLLRESGFISLSPGAKRPSFMCDLFWTWCAQSGAKIDLLTKWTINTWNVLNQAFLPFLFERNFWLILLKGFASRGQKITMRELLFQKLCFILH